MIDLHIHTSNSDGTYSVLDLLKFSESNGLESISFTDHNTLGAYNELSNINIKDYYSGQIINGCEIKCKFDGRAIEVLAYNFTDFKVLHNWLDKYFSKEVAKNNQIKQLQYLKEVCDELGLKYDEDLTITSSNPWAALGIILNLVKFEENKKYFDKRIWDSPALFYRECCCSRSNPFYVDETTEIPDVSEVIEIVTKAGGKCFLAHLYEYSLEKHENFLEKLVKETNIHGVECYHSSFSNAQINSLLKFCNENNLLISGGTDFHGDFKPNIKLGIGTGDLNIPSYITTSWNVEGNK